MSRPISFNAHAIFISLSVGFAACTVEDQRTYIQSGAPMH